MLWRNICGLLRDYASSFIHESKRTNRWIVAGLRAFLSGGMRNLAWEKQRSAGVDVTGMAR